MRRKSIHENDQHIRDKSPFLQHQKEYSVSPVRRKNDLYPDLKHLINESEATLSNNEENESVEEESLEQSGHSDINESNAPQQTNYTLIMIISLVIVILAGLLLSLGPENKKESVPSKGLIDCSQLINLKEKYPHQNPKIFKSLQVLAEGVFNRNSKPVVFTFFSTDQTILDDLLKDVAHVTQQCIKQSYEPINLTHSDLNREKFLNDYTKIIGEYKDELEKRSILVIHNLDELSSKIVPSLHSFTDTYNPLVEKSIIYLSIRVPQKPSNPADYIFTHLQNKWNDLASNIKNPLIARLLDQAFFLQPRY
jgi:hypothetical protein